VRIKNQIQGEEGDEGEKEMGKELLVKVGTSKRLAGRGNKDTFATGQVKAGWTRGATGKGKVACALSMFTQITDWGPD
jgi:hypothetical protein